MKKILLLGTLALLGCSKDPKPSESYQPLFERFRAAVIPLRTAESSYRVLDLATVTDFTWDSVYYFTAYQSERNISAAVGVAWQGPEVPDHAKRLLFVRAGQVVTFVDFPRYAYPDEPESVPIRLYSCDPSQRLVYSRQAARFAVSRYCDQYGIEYQLVPVTCLDKDTGWVHLLTHGCSPETSKALADSAAARLARIR